MHYAYDIYISLVDAMMIRGLKRDSDNDGVGQKSTLTCITHDYMSHDPLAALLCKRFNDSPFNSNNDVYKFICKGTKILVCHM